MPSLLPLALLLVMARPPWLAELAQELTLLLFWRELRQLVPA